MAISTIFYDVGGVLLTNGWDRDSRTSVAAAFALDPGEFEDRHEAVVHDFETGRMDLATYLRRTVFHAPRPFTADEFVTAMKAESKPIPGSLELLAQVARHDVLLVTLNNESRELNDHRIETFGLRSYFRAFLSSCYVGHKKPEPSIYRMAFALTQARPDEALFIDDRLVNLECAADEGLRGIHFTGVEQLRSALVTEGVLPP